MTVWAFFGRSSAALVLLILLPVNLTIALLLRILQGSGVLFRQERSGFRGLPFKLVKFRTMRDLRDSEGNLLADEARVTAIGTFLRKTRLDELPSFWNVLAGDLAYVGPRPLLTETVLSLGERGKRRGDVLPGLTGWAQINGNTMLTLDEKVSLDLAYIERRRWNTDAYVIIRTVWVMINGEKRRDDILIP
ncbi:sugar transferase [Sphingopyxis sp.]|uniref:sugar transferase n=1 Tax=Sphingopyxis sp. TaxID=1908224 RepID=UPI003D0B255C